MIFAGLAKVILVNFPEGSWVLGLLIRVSQEGLK